MVLVYGSGHVGASLSAVWLRSGLKVIGVDVSESVVRAALEGLTYINEPGIEEAFTEGLKSKHFTATTDAVQASKDSDFKIVAVPVVISNGSIELSAIKNVATKRLKLCTY